MLRRDFIAGSMSAPLSLKTSTIDEATDVDTAVELLRRALAADRSIGHFEITIDRHGSVPVLIAAFAA